MFVSTIMMLDEVGTVLEILDAAGVGTDDYAIGRSKILLKQAGVSGLNTTVQVPKENKRTKTEWRPWVQKYGGW